MGHSTSSFPVTTLCYVCVFSHFFSPPPPPRERLLSKKGGREGGIGLMWREPLCLDLGPDEGEWEVSADVCMWKSCQLD